MSPSSANINKTQTQKRVLVAPLDWGLGHATRCVPLINALLAQGFEVLIAAEGSGAALLAQEFPGLKILPIHGYNVRYSQGRQFFFLKMVFQSAKVSAAIKKENAWLIKAAEEHLIDIVISDNRFGLYHKSLHCVFMTHQLFIKTGNSITEKIAQKINYHYISRFNECWVPDHPGADNLAGELSHPGKMPPVPVKYIGALSRFIKNDAEKNTDVLAIVSGPEPQRSLFEEILRKQLNIPGKKNVLVRGLPGKIITRKGSCENPVLIDHLPASELNKLALSAKIVIARSGYSSVMDLAALQQKAILIPTPGQAEQEYLAGYLSQKKYCIAVAQEVLDLRNILPAAGETELQPFTTGSGALLKAAISSLV